MRDIRFRGKSLDTGFWEYGFYFPREQGGGGKLAHFIASPGGRTIEVDPETVTEFSSLCDKIETGIFEGDYIKHDARSIYQSDVYVTEVFFEDGGFKIKVPGELGSVRVKMLSVYNLEYFEVVGNRFDNKEFKNLLVC